MTGRGGTDCAILKTGQRLLVGSVHRQQQPACGPAVPGDRMLGAIVLIALQYGIIRQGKIEIHDAFR
ncbi:hypothetical protein SDC9_101487 [bioreactor metagenome]|uniref:Uncharacterized protein n=1 Tax=bioreactor metagenome TaxID=1076179 RepID=A0A645ANT8_9ZZZZ